MLYILFFTIILLINSTPLEEDINFDKEIVWNTVGNLLLKYVKYFNNTNKDFHKWLVSSETSMPYHTKNKILQRLNYSVIQEHDLIPFMIDTNFYSVDSDLKIVDEYLEDLYYKLKKGHKDGLFDVEGGSMANTRRFIILTEQIVSNIKKGKEKLDRGYYKEVYKFIISATGRYKDYSKVIKKVR